MSPAKDPIRNNTDETPISSATTPAASFAKEERLCGKTSIDAIFRSGSSLREHPIVVKYGVTSIGHIRLLIAVPKKLHRKAVTRNLLKRRIREAYRTNKYLLVGESLDMAFIYQAKEVLSFQEIQEKLINLMTRLRKKTSAQKSESSGRNISSNE